MGWEVLRQEKAADLTELANLQYLNLLSKYFN